MATQSKWYLVTANLIYPAFLGSMCYVAAEQLLKKPCSFDTASGVLVFALIAHYVMDWMYTVINSDQSKGSFLKFVSDVVIVFCLYITLRLAIPGSDEIVLFRGAWDWLKQPVYWLLITKIFAIAWELSEVESLHPKKWSRCKLIALGMDGGFGILYLLLASTAAGVSCFNLLLAFAVLSDAVCYVVYDHFCPKIDSKILLTVCARPSPSIKRAALKRGPYVKR